MKQTQQTKNSKRGRLFQLVCLAFFAPTSTMGFTTTMFSTTASNPLQDSTAKVTSQRSNSRRMRHNSLLLAASTTKNKSFAMSSDLPRLSAEEEKELLRQAVEMRRITKIESDLKMSRSSSSMGRGSEPLLLERAMAAGYGEELDAYEDAIADGHRARDLLVTRNMGLVHYCIQQIVGSRQHLNSLSRDDLAQEGAIGLARAVDKWNPTIGGKFSTYAVYWIRAAILRCIAERDDMLRVPAHVSQAVRSIDKAAQSIGIDLTSSNWRKANAAKQLAEAAGLSDSNFEVAMKVRSRRKTGGYVAFESWMQRGSNLVSDITTGSGTSSNSLDSSAEEQQDGFSDEDVEHLRTTLSQYLRPREMEALSWRYGLVKETSNSNNQESAKDKANRYFAEAEEELFGKTTASSSKTATTVNTAVPTKGGRWGEAMSFNEVGTKMQVSAEYGRRLCHAALAKLQQAAEEGHLEPALLF